MPNRIAQRGPVSLVRHIGLALAAAAALLGACDSAPKGRVAAQKPTETVTRDVPSILRNTIGAEATLRGSEPILVSGYGLVVGLAGTGARDVPLAVRSLMEREMTTMGVGQGIGPLANVSPAEMMEDPNNAVVLVRAVIQPGAPVGTRFDVFIEALPGTATTSLEGGRLYTTRLFKGLVRPAMPATRPVAEAKGELFINPFADPASEDGGALRTTGRILNGGMVTEALGLQVVLDNASHSRARAVTDAINSAFPRRNNARNTARGVNDEIIEVAVPEEFLGRNDEFLLLLQHTRIDPQFPKEWALRYTRALKEQPELAIPISWALQALGPAAIPFARELYADPEEMPRLAAIQAGARLGDALVRPHLEELATAGPPAIRSSAFDLLGRLPPDPAVNRFLREQLDSPDVNSRIAAYEALARRADPVIQRTRLGDAFELDLVPTGEPMIYVSQQKQARIAVFGADPQVQRPVFVSAWSDRLMVSAQGNADRVNVFYRDYRTGRATTNPVKASLPEFIEFLAHKSTPEEPEPGLGFTYSETVGALYEMVRHGAIPGVFVPETDRLALEIVRSAQTEAGADRPETEPEASPDETPGAKGDDSSPGAPDAARVGARPAAAPRPVERPDTSATSAADRAETPSRDAKQRRQYVIPLGPPPAPTDKDGKPAKPPASRAGSRDVP